MRFKCFLISFILLAALPARSQVNISGQGNPPQTPHSAGTWSLCGVYGCNTATPQPTPNIEDPRTVNPCPSSDLTTHPEETQPERQYYIALAAQNGALTVNPGIGSPNGTITKGQGSTNYTNITTDSAQERQYTNEPVQAPNPVSPSTGPTSATITEMVVRHRNHTRTVYEPGKAPRTEPDPDTSRIPWTFSENDDPIEVPSYEGRVERLSKEEYQWLKCLRDSVDKAEKQLVEAQRLVALAHKVNLYSPALEPGFTIGGSATYFHNSYSPYTYIDSYEFRGQFLLINVPKALPNN